MVKNLHSGLGRGLDALLKDIEINDREKIEQLRTSDITANPFQPRINFDDAAINELAQSIKKYGVLQPVIVKRTDNTYQLIAGERRLRACRKADIDTIPAIVRNYTDNEVAQIALIENLQREDLNAIEEAAGYQRLISETGLTQNDLSKYVGKSRSHIANFLRLLHLSKGIQNYIMKGTLNMGQAKPLVSIRDEVLQRETALYIISNELSARDAEAIVKKVLKDPDYFNAKKKKPAKPKDVFISNAENKLELLLGAKVSIKTSSSKSKIEIEFASAEDLSRIIETFIKEKETAEKIENKQDFFV